MNTTNERYKLNKELAQMLKGGVIMDVTTPEQAKIAEGCRCMCSHGPGAYPRRYPCAGRRLRMSDPKMIQGIQNAVLSRLWQNAVSDISWRLRFSKRSKSTTLMRVKYSPLPMMFIISTNATSVFRLSVVQKTSEKLLRRINEGASMIRTKGEPGTGDIVQAVRHMRKMNSEIAKLTSMREDELFEAAKTLQVPYELVAYVHDNGRLPVVNFAAGGVATPADAALMMQLGAEGVFVGSGIFKSGNPEKRATCDRKSCY